MTNKTKPKILSELSQIAKEKLDLVPAWVANNYPNFQECDYQVMEGGCMALVVNVGDKIILKILVAKYDWMENSPSRAKIPFNYQRLSNSGFDIGQLGILRIDLQDRIFDCGVVVTQFISNSQPLANLFYQMTTPEQKNIISKVVIQLKNFNQPVDLEYNTQELLDSFDERFETAKDRLGSLDKAFFESIRDSFKPLIINHTYLVHEDVHLENILIDDVGEMHFIDYDFCRIAPVFLELDTIFLFCFYPTVTVAEELEVFYQEPMVEVFEQFVLEYPELWNNKYLPAIKLIFATEILNKYPHQKFQNNTIFAIQYLKTL